MKHDWLRGKFKKNKASLYEAEATEYGRFQGGNVLYNSVFFTLRPLGRGEPAWQTIAADPDAIEATLICSSCDEHHVFKRVADRGVRALTGSRIGRFSSDYDGRHWSDWFVLSRSGLGFSGLDCQSCRHHGGPRMKFS
jgi:hypothetical protein